MESLTDDCVLSSKNRARIAGADRELIDEEMYTCAENCQLK